MKITLKRTPEQIELVKAMASRNRTVAYEAQVALAEFMGPVLAEVINQAPTLSNLFTTLQFNADDNPSIPLDLYYDINDEDYIKVYSQSHAGGLPTNQVLPTASEMKIATYSLDTAVSFDRRYAAKSRMDVVSKTFTRAAQEILAKQETTSASLIMGSLADASTNGKDHVFRNTYESLNFVLDDINKLMTLAKRIQASFLGGSPAGGTAKGITDLIVSPEVVEKLRAMAYNPINTSNGPAASGGTGADGIAAPDELRMSVYSSAGLPEFYGISIMEILELGANKRFTNLFDTAQGAASASDGAKLFTTGDDLVIGIDRSRESLIRAVAIDEDSGGEFNLIADDQYSIRQQKIGYFGSLEEGRMVLDNRALVGCVVSKSA